jgi:hypothetical protein
MSDIGKWRSEVRFNLPWSVAAPASAVGKMRQPLENHLLSLRARHFLPPRGRLVSFNVLQLANGNVIANPETECEAQMRSLGGLQADRRSS